MPLLILHSHFLLFAYFGRHRVIPLANLLSTLHSPVLLEPRVNEAEQSLDGDDSCYSTAALDQNINEAYCDAQTCSICKNLAYLYA